MKLLLALFLILCLSSCQTMLKTIHGARQPRVQTAEQIHKWLQRGGLHPQQIASVQPEAFTQVFMDCADGPKVFTVDGSLIPIGYRDGKFCPQGLDQMLVALKPLPPKAATAASWYVLEQNSPPASRQRHLDTFFPYLRTLQGKILDAPSKDVDYIVLIPFALWMGRRFQTKDMRTVVQALAQNPHARFSIWYVNLDKQAWWGEDWNTMIVVK